jgi:hypothetical protein
MPHHVHAAGLSPCRQAPGRSSVAGANVLRETSAVPASGDPLALLIESELRPLAKVLARLIASELRVLLIQPTDSKILESQSNGDGPACRVCGRPAEAGRRVCRRCRKVAGREREREQQARAAEAAAVRSGKRGPRAAELANGVRADPAKPGVGALAP